VALRDSGSGAFAFVGGTWRLVGTATATYAEGLESPFTAPLDFQGSIYTDISSYKPAIDAAIGAALVPEPSFGCLMALGGLGLLLIRRRAPLPA